MPAWLLGLRSVDESLLLSWFLPLNSHAALWFHPSPFVSHRLWRSIKNERADASPGHAHFVKSICKRRITHVTRNREYSSFQPQHFLSTKLWIAFQRHNESYLRSRSETAGLRALRGRGRSAFHSRRRFDSNQPT